ncbi:hypothetical protein ABE142_24250 [Paenibacillus alvei]|uniref:hypothetical protein n=1 Tax=Paenibacillus alvei TaxID=44250 RepID=UPI003D27782D
MKKFISTLLVFTLILVFSTSAFAAKGVGDTKESAINLDPGASYTLFIQDSTDKDWYKWTNQTGKTKRFGSWLNGNDGDNRNFRFGFIIKYSDGITSEFHYANHYPGPSQILGNLYIPDGATLYLSVERVVDTIAQYTISLHAYDV